MAKLERLIEGQDIAFDTHQAGDGQPVRTEDLHLEKRLHDRQGKIRFPFLGDSDPSWSRGVTEDRYDSVVSEVRRALKKNPTLVKRLGKTLVEQLRRFSGGRATVKQAESAAQKIAKAFNLDDKFVESVAKFANGRLVQFVSQHDRLTHGPKMEIAQSEKRIEVRTARSVYSARWRSKRRRHAR